MKTFLSAERMEALKNKLNGMCIDGKPVGISDKVLNVPDDLAEVDLNMTAHVLAIKMFLEKGEDAQASIGLVFLMAFMEEAQSRGLGENDFPISLEAIKDDLTDRGIVTLQ